MKACSKCGIEKPLTEFNKSTKTGTQSNCRACSKAIAADYYAKNALRIKAKQKENAEASREASRKWRASEKGKAYNESEKTKAARHKWASENKEIRRKLERDLYRRNPEKFKLKSLLAREKNPLPMLIATKKWYERNRDAALEKSKSWARCNRDKRRASEATRRFRKAATGGRHTDADIRALLTNQRGKCACCQSDLDDTFHVDHIMPLALGGSNDKSNIQLLCKTCNLKKAAKHPIDFMQSIGKLL